MPPHSPAAGLSRARRARTARSWLGPDFGQPFDPDRETDGRDRRRRTKAREQFVIAPARDELTAGVHLLIVQFEHEPRVVIEAASKRGGKFDARDIHALCGEKAG